MTHPGTATGVSIASALVGYAATSLPFLQVVATLVSIVAGTLAIIARLRSFRG